ncbi:hypothetical protein D3C85_375450 [compost metagenome]
MQGISVSTTDHGLLSFNDVIAAQREFSTGVAIDFDDTDAFYRLRAGATHIADHQLRLACTIAAYMQAVSSAVIAIEFGIQEHRAAVAGVVASHGQGGADCISLEIAGHHAAIVQRRYRLSVAIGIQHTCRDREIRSRTEGGGRAGLQDAAGDGGAAGIAADAGQLHDARAGLDECKFAGATIPDQARKAAVSQLRAIDGEHAVIGAAIFDDAGTGIHTVDGANDRTVTIELERAAGAPRKIVDVVETDIRGIGQGIGRQNVQHAVHIENLGSAADGVCRRSVQGTRLGKPLFSAGYGIGSRGIQRARVKERLHSAIDGVGSRGVQRAREGEILPSTGDGVGSRGVQRARVAEILPSTGDGIGS